MKLAVLTNILTPYRLPLFEELAVRCDDFRVLVMAGAHRNRSWSLPSSHFSVEVLPGWHVQLPNREEPIHINHGVARALRRFAPDAVLDGCYTPASWAAYRYCRRQRIMHVPWGELTLQDGAEKSYSKRWIRRRIVSGSAAAVASSTATRDAFVHYGMPARNVLLATMPVQSDFFRAAAGELRSGEDGGLRRNRAAPLLLAAGQLVDRKGYPELFAAVARLQSTIPGIQLVIAGDGPRRAEYETMIRDLGLRGVRFLGFVPPRDLAAWFVAADAFVFPSRFDCFGAVVPEAMAAGAVIVASRHAAATLDLVTDGETGFVIDPLEPRSFDDGLRKALGLSAAERALLTQRAVDRACRNTYAANAAAIVQFLQDVRKGYAAPAGKGAGVERSPRTSS